MICVWEKGWGPIYLLGCEKKHINTPYHSKFFILNGNFNRNLPVIGQTKNNNMAKDIYTTVLMENNFWMHSRHEIWMRLNQLFHLDKSE